MTYNSIKAVETDKNLSEEIKQGAHVEYVIAGKLYDIGCPPTPERLKEGKENFQMKEVNDFLATRNGN